MNMATLKLVLDKRRRKSNGTYPIVFRLTHLQKSTTIPTSLSLIPADRDNKKQKVKKCNSTSDTLNHELNKLRLALQDKLMKVDSNSQFDVTAIKNVITGKAEPKASLNFFSFAKKEIQTLLATNKIGNAVIYECAVNSLKGFVNNPKLRFEEINYKLLTEYEAHLVKKELKINSIANYMRTIRAIYNKSVKTNNTSVVHYPFKSYSIKHERTIAKVLTKESFEKINSLELKENSPEYLSRAIFQLIFNLIGISFVDLIALKPANIIDGRIVYRRKKTKRVYSIKMNHFAEAIIADLKKLYPDTPYLLPLLSNDKMSPIEERKTIQLRIQTCNKYLKRIGKELELDLILTTYVARYTWATTAKRLGYSNEIIAEALGHEYGNSVTATYLDGFSQEIIDSTNEAVTKMMFAKSLK